MLDVESGSVMQLDKVAFEIINARISGTGNFASKTKKELEIEQEIEELRERGLIDSPPTVHAKRKWDGAIKAMCLNVSHECNLTCGYCFAADVIATPMTEANMSPELAVRAIEFLAANSGNRRYLEVDFFGGEPLLNMPAVRAAVERGRQIEKETDKVFRFTLTTNGALLTDDIIDFVNSEISNVVISIDGRKEVHNAVRKLKGIRNDGQGSYDIVVERAKELIKKRDKRAEGEKKNIFNDGNTDYFIRGTYTTKNTDFVSDVRWLYNEGFNNLSLEPVVLADGHALALKDSDIERCVDEYERLAEEMLRREKKADRELKFFHFNIDLAGGPCESKRLTACGAGYEYIAVDPMGDVYPCHQFVGQAEYRLGNIAERLCHCEERSDEAISCKEYSTRGIASSALPPRNDALNQQKMKEFSGFSLLDKPECTKCWAKYYCGGGCMANAVMCGAGIKGIHKQSCKLMKKRIECGIALGAIEK